MDKAMEVVKKKKKKESKKKKSKEGMGQKLGHVGLVKKKSFYFFYFLFFFFFGLEGNWEVSVVWFVLPRLAVSPSCLGWWD